MKKIHIFVIFLVFFIPFLVSAAVMKSGERVNLEQGVTSDDVYAAGGTVNSAANVNGDFVTAGGNILISGPVSQDIIVAGGSLSILGSVGDDLRAAGGNIVISGNVNDDLVAAGGQIDLLPDASVGGDVLVAGGSVVLGGDVRGDVRIGGGEVAINGTVNGDVHVMAEKVTIGEGAVIRGKLTYTSPNEAEIKDGAEIVGGISFSKSKGKPTPVAGFVGFALVFKLLMLFVSALVVQWFLKNFANKIITRSTEKVLSSLGLGFVILVVVPIAAVVAMATVVGIPLAILTILGYVATLVFSCLFVPVFLGAVVWKYFKKNESIVLNWKTALLGSFVAMILGLIPFIGWVVWFAVFLIALGGLFKIKKEYVVKIREGNMNLM